MDGGFTHEYAMSDSEPETSAAASTTGASRLKIPRGARQAAGTAKGLEALARRRAEATEKKLAAKSAGGAGAGAGAGALGEYPDSTMLPEGAGGGSAAAAYPTGRKPGRPRATPTGTTLVHDPPVAPPAGAGLHLSAGGIDPLAMARIAQMEIELEKLRRKKKSKAKAPPARRSKKGSRRSDDDDATGSSSEDASETTSSSSEEEEEAAPARKRRRAVSKSPKRMPAKPARREVASAPPAAARAPIREDFFDALMSSQFGRH